MVGDAFSCLPVCNYFVTPRYLFVFLRPLQCKFPYFDRLKESLHEGKVEALEKLEDGKQKLKDSLQKKKRGDSVGGMSDDEVRPIRFGFWIAGVCIGESCIGKLRII